VEWASLLEFVIGLAITLATLSDVFAGVLVPGAASGWLGVASAVRTITLPVWRRVTRVHEHRNRRLSNFFAPALFLLVFLAWMALLLAGFGLMVHAASSYFKPPLASFSQALYVAGSSILTLGVSEVDALGSGRWLLLSAALSGFSIITATVTFILQVQTALHQREAGVLTLSGMAGRPGSGIELLETFAQLDMLAELPEFFRYWRNWSASVLHSHVAHPVLGYFHSVDAESDWLSALTVLLDAATLSLVFTQGPATGAATLMHRAGSRTAARLCELYKLDDCVPEPPAPTVIDALVERLARAGYAMRDQHDPGSRFHRMRTDYFGRMAALAAHLGAEPIALLPAADQPVAA
jgi:hypothetical protein